MQRVKRSVLVPYSATEMFTLVDDVDDYPRFLPWCSGAEILELRPDGKIARLHIDYRGVRTHFTTDNVNAAPRSIRISLKEGPFRSLTGEWTFNALATDACKVELVLAYAFGTSLLETAIGPVFDRIARTFIDAFVQRAEGLHDKPGR
ncbi:MAG: type II toxin-antitoxin system RatA family toxin [Burkholderiales bacterium]|nr:type II toxin-antitoxin system RatA family toxin [Burkholderiales bacterium]